MGFNLQDYETVKSRKKRFYEKYPDGRIIVKLINPETVEKMALFYASVYASSADQSHGLPIATGHAFEIRDTEKQKNKYGQEFESVNYSSWTENSEESAVGRALDNAGFSGNNKCSREEIEKADRMKVTLSPPKPKLTDPDVIPTNTALTTDGIKSKLESIKSLLASKGVTNKESQKEFIFKIIEKPFSQFTDDDFQTLVKKIVELK